MAASESELQTQLAHFDAHVKLFTLKAVCGRPFVNTARFAKEWLSAERIDSILRTIWFKEVNPQETGQKIWDQSLRVFCIVASLKRPELIKIFSEIDCKDNSLPEYDQNSLEHRLYAAGCREARQIAQQFVETQWSFCAWTFCHGDGNKRHLEDRILPITRQELIRRGGTAELHQIEVPAEFLDRSLKDKFPRSGYPHPGGGKYYRFALKVFRESGLEDYENEKTAFHALRLHHGVVSCLGTFMWKSRHFRPEEQHAHSTYNILLEYGVSDLEVYFTTRHPPFFAGEIHHFWEQLFDLASALENLHNIRPGNGSKQKGWLGWHADIKPANILLIEDKFRLADPGFAQFAQEATAVMRGGTVAYGAPELPRTRNEAKAVSQKIDIWSLGCVFSVAATWVVGGHPAVAQFQQIRKDALRKSGSSSDWFHDGQKVLDAILEWHRILRDNLRNSDPITAKVLGLIEEKMLVGDPQQRCDAKALCIELKLLAIKSRPPKLPLSTTTKQIMQSLQSVDDKSPDHPSKVNSSDDRIDQQSDHRKERQRLLDVAVKKTAFRSEYLSQKIGQSEVGSRPETVPSWGPASLGNANEAKKTLPFRGHQQYPSIDTALYNNQSDGATGENEQDGNNLSPTSPSQPPMIHRRTPKERPHEHLSIFQARERLENKYSIYTRTGIMNKVWRKNHVDKILREYYDNRDIRFLIDTSGSMRRHWPQVKYIAKTLVWHCSGHDDDGIDVDFTRPSEDTRNNINHKELSRLLEDRITPPTDDVKTDMKKRLQTLFDKLLADYKRKKKSISLIILTDGKWDAMDLDDGTHTLGEIKDIIASFVKDITEEAGRKLPPPIGIQFVQFGNNAFATEALRRLDNDLCREKRIPDVIDLEPADGGDVNKMLLGNFVPAYDAADVDDESIFARSRSQSPDLASPTSPSHSKFWTG